MIWLLKEGNPPWKGGASKLHLRFDFVIKKEKKFPVYWDV
jgi:hypothetical protein